MFKWKQIMSVLLAVTVLLSLLSACNSKNVKTPGSETTDPAAVEIPEPTLTPYIQEQEAALQQELERLAAKGEKLVITIALPTNVNVEHYDTNAYTLWLEEQTGYDLQFEPIQLTPHYSGAYDLNNPEVELPDVLWNFNMGAAYYESYGANGIFVDLSPYYKDEVLSASFWERLSAIPDEQYRQSVVDWLTAEDEGMYAFSKVEYSLSDTTQYQVYINQTWLDTLGLDMPHDFASLKEVLIAFRDKDPNGNGKKDELPLIGSISASSGNIVMWLINMFTYVNNASYFNVDENGRLYLPHATDEYRQALLEIRDLIKEGLMFPSAFSMSNKEIRSLMNPYFEGDVVTVGVVAGDLDVICEEDNPAIYNYVAMPYWGYCNRNVNSFTPATFITKDCEYPLAAWKLMMLMCSEEGSLRAFYGEKGVDWDDADPETLTALGNPAQIKVIREDVLTTKGNSVWGSVQGNILVSDGFEICQITDDMGQWVNKKMKTMADSYFYYIEGENSNRPEEREGVYPLPLLDVPVDISELIADEKSDSRYLIGQALTAFSSGSYIVSFNEHYLVDVTDDDHWNAYLAALEKAGYKVWMENYQRLLDEQYPDYVENFVHREVLP